MTATARGVASWADAWSWTVPKIDVSSSSPATLASAYRSTSERPDSPNRPP